MTTVDERRARRAARTKDEIVEAGATLFERHGMFRTTVEQVAELADVAPATVYAVAGGKSGVLAELMSRWADAAEAVDTEAVLAACASSAEVAAAVGEASAGVQSEHGRTMRIALDTAPHDQVAQDAIEAATRRYRRTVLRAAERVHELEPTRHPDPAAVAETLWFYFGYGAWATLRTDLNWPLDQARGWLVEQATTALAR